MALRRAVRGLWAGELGLFGFVDQMNSAIRLHLNNAWFDGMKDEGLDRRDITPVEIQARDDLVNSEMLYVLDFGRDIIDHDKETGGALAPHLSRVERWASRYGRVRARARLLAAQDKKKKWVMNPEKENCDDCIRLDGRVYRASIWAKYGIEPRSPDLACFGTSCGCEFVDTDERVTPGRPPNLIGPRRKIAHALKHWLGIEHNHLKIS